MTCLKHLTLVQTSDISWALHFTLSFGNGGIFHMNWEHVVTPHFDLYFQKIFKISAICWMFIIIFFLLPVVLRLAWKLLNKYLSGNALKFTNLLWIIGYEIGLTPFSKICITGFILFEVLPEVSNPLTLIQLPLIKLTAPQQNIFTSKWYAHKTSGSTIFLWDCRVYFWWENRQIVKFIITYIIGVLSSSLRCVIAWSAWRRGYQGDRGVSSTAGRSKSWRRSIATTSGTVQTTTCCRATASAGVTGTPTFCTTGSVVTAQIGPQRTTVEHPH